MNVEPKQVGVWPSTPRTAVLQLDVDGVRQVLAIGYQLATWPYLTVVVDLTKLTARGKHSDLLGELADERSGQSRRMLGARVGIRDDRVEPFGN